MNNQTIRMVVLPTTPPKTYSSLFYKATVLAIYVQPGAIDTYKTTQYWSLKASVILPIGGDDYVENIGNMYDEYFDNNY